jgi:hypothetical protein
MWWNTHAYVVSDQDWTLKWATHTHHKPDQTDWHDIPGVSSILVRKDELPRYAVPGCCAMPEGNDQR